MGLTAWFAIWTALASVLVLDTLLIRTARLKQRRRRFRGDRQDWAFGLFIATSLTVVAVAVGSMLWPEAEKPKTYWMLKNDTLTTFPNKP